MTSPCGLAGYDVGRRARQSPNVTSVKGRRDVHSQDQCSIRWDETWEATVVPEKCSSVNGLKFRGVLESRRPSMLYRKESIGLRRLTGRRRHSHCWLGRNLAESRPEEKGLKMQLAECRCGHTQKWSRCSFPPGSSR